MKRQKKHYSKKRRITAAVFSIILFLFIIRFYHDNKPGYDSTLYNYYIENGQEDTSADNLVCAVYLDYRVFDTLFEALLLIIAVTGIIYFITPWENEDKNEE